MNMRVGPLVDLTNPLKSIEGLTKGMIARTKEQSRLRQESIRTSLSRRGLAIREEQLDMAKRKSLRDVAAQKRKSEMDDENFRLGQQEKELNIRSKTIEVENEEALESALLRFGDLSSSDYGISNRAFVDAVYQLSKEMNDPDDYENRELKGRQKRAIQKYMEGKHDKAVERLTKFLAVTSVNTESQGTGTAVALLDADVDEILKKNDPNNKVPGSNNIVYQNMRDMWVDLNLKGRVVVDEANKTVVLRTLGEALDLKLFTPQQAVVLRAIVEGDPKIAHQLGEFSVIPVTQTDPFGKPRQTVSVSWKPQSAKSLLALYQENPEAVIKYWNAFEKVKSKYDKTGDKLPGQSYVDRIQQHKDKIKIAEVAIKATALDQKVIDLLNREGILMGFNISVGRQLNEEQKGVLSKYVKDLGRMIGGQERILKDNYELAWDYYIGSQAPTNIPYENTISFGQPTPVPTAVSTPGATELNDIPVLKIPTQGAPK